jgi:DNA-binding ferritin-like protein
MVIDQLTKTQALAEKNKKMGLANFLQDRIDAHEKHGWMLRSITKV